MKKKAPKAGKAKGKRSVKDLAAKKAAAVKGGAFDVFSPKSTSTTSSPTRLTAYKFY